MTIDRLRSDLLDLIRKQLESSGIQPPAPAKPEVLKNLDERIHEAFGSRMPAAYFEFLSEMDGFYLGSFYFAGTNRQAVLKCDGTPYGDLEIPDVITHAREIEVDYEPKFDGMITITYGDSFHGWDPKKKAWFHGYYDVGVSRWYGSLNELLADLLHDSAVGVRHLMPTTFRFSSLDIDGAAVFGELEDCDAWEPTD